MSCRTLHCACILIVYKAIISVIVGGVDSGVKFCDQLYLALRTFLNVILAAVCSICNNCIHLYACVFCLVYNILQIVSVSLFSGCDHDSGYKAIVRHGNMRLVTVELSCIRLMPSSCIPIIAGCVMIHYIFTGLLKKIKFLRHGG